MPIDPTLNRWPRIREEAICPMCSGHKSPSKLMCAPCFERNKAGSGGITNVTRFSLDIERRLTEIENNLEDTADPWRGAMDDFAREFPNW